MISLLDKIQCEPIVGAARAQYEFLVCNLKRGEIFNAQRNELGKKEIRLIGRVCSDQARSVIRIDNLNEPTPQFRRRVFGRL